jgi:hypothetical protein
LKGGTYYEFNYPKSMGTYGLGINDEKVVVGLYAPDNDYQGGFVATY